MDSPELSPSTRNWLNERSMPANWWNVGPEDEIPTDLLGWNRTMLHMFQVSFAPGIRRRLDAKTLDESFFLTSAQLIQPEDGTAAVRLNEEVKGLAYLKVDRPVEKGGDVYYAEFRNLESFDVVEEELNCGHFTKFWHGDGWIGTFDFRSSRERAGQSLKLAEQFLEAATFCASQGFAGPSTDNLFSGCELVAKAH